MSNSPEERRPERPLSLLGNYGSQNQPGQPTAPSIDTKNPSGRVPYAQTGPYVPMPRPFAGGEFLDTTGRDPVRIPVFVDTTSPRGVSLASDINSILNSDRYSKSDANALWDQLPRETQDALTQIARSQGGRSGKALWERSVNTSYLSTKQGNPMSPWEVIGSSGGDVQPTGGAGGRSRGGRAPAYDGPMESVQVAAETDIVAMAQATAQELLGRSATQKELDKILKRTRKAEQTQPTVQTRQGPGRVTTEEGLTKAGRDAILRKVLMQSPDYASYQFDSTVMDMMMDNLRRGQQVARG
jgi:hypothetical protein